MKTTHDYLKKQLKDKMAENESLTQTIKDQTPKLNISKDEMFQRFVLVLHVAQFSFKR
jgi:hypothetical protein